MNAKLKTSTSLNNVGEHGVANASIQLSGLCPLWQW